MPVKYLESVNEFQYLMNNIPNQVIVFDFTASWCGPCQAIAPHYKQLSMNYPEVLFFKVDIDDFPQLSTQLNVSGVPHFMFFINGRLEKQFSGANLPLLKQTVNDLYVKAKNIPTLQRQQTSIPARRPPYQLNPFGSFQGGIKNLPPDAYINRPPEPAPSSSNLPAQNLDE